MSQSGNTALARRWFDDVWNKRREATITEMLHPDAVGHLEGLVTRGVAEFVPAVCEGDNVVVRWAVTGTHRGDNLGIPATGRPVAFRGITWLRFANGRLVEGWDSWNQGRLMQELQAAAANGAT